jgi:hypothetical protein
MLTEANILFWSAFALVCVGLVPLLGGAMLRLGCKATGVAGVRFGRCWLAYLAAYAIASAVGVPLLLLLPSRHGVPAPFTVVVWLVAALVVHALVVPRVLRTPVRRTLVAHGIALVLTTGVIAALALPGIVFLRAGARRVERSQQFYNVGKALTDFAQSGGDEREHLVPAAIYSPDGKPLLSWRVALLPYLDQQALYDQFKLDEPWDSPHNLALVPRMPRIFGEGEPELDSGGTTRMRVMVSAPSQHPRTPFVRGDRRGMNLAAVGYDGMSRTVVVIEMAEPSVWTSPEEPEFATGRPLPPFGNPGRDRFVYALYADGSVRALRADNPPNIWEALLTCDGGEDVEPH